MYLHFWNQNGGERIKIPFHRHFRNIKIFHISKTNLFATFITCFLSLVLHIVFFFYNTSCNFKNETAIQLRSSSAHIFEWSFELLSFSLSWVSSWVLLRYRLGYQLGYHLPYYLAYFLPSLRVPYECHSECHPECQLNSLRVSFLVVHIPLIIRSSKMIEFHLVHFEQDKTHAPASASTWVSFISYPDIWRLRPNFTTPFTTPFLPQTTPFSDKIRYLCIFTKSPQTLENTAFLSTLRNLKNMLP